MRRVVVFGTALAIATMMAPVALAAPVIVPLLPAGGDHVEDAGDVAAASVPATSSKRRSKRLRRAIKPSVRVVSEDQLRKEPLPPPSGALRLTGLSRSEAAVEVNIYNQDGSYSIEALRSLDHVLRCRRTHAEKPIEPRLFVILSHIYDHFGRKEIEVVSGYRNQRKKSSFHYKGTATDIRISGVSPRKLRAFVETLDTGGLGIGLYPRSGFVHVDIRPLPSTRWIDYSPPNSNARDKRPPRGWKRKKLQS